MSTSEAAGCAEPVRRALVQALLATADDDFLIGHVDSEWTGLAPILEEDIAFSAIAQDEIAHAREWYRLIGELTDRTADELAYARPPHDYRCAALVVRPDAFDWGAAIARQFYYEHFDALRLERWKASSDSQIAHVAARIAAEEAFHVHHVDDWVRRLAADVAEGRERIQTALDQLWPHAATLFEET
ncbi:MAG: 1,2-phenylacetyl-CoA epoxidase subunit PaaC, partial [Phycisphaerae bacterium]